MRLFPGNLDRTSDLTLLWLLTMFREWHVCLFVCFSADCSVSLPCVSCIYKFITTSSGTFSPQWICYNLLCVCAEPCLMYHTGTCGSYILYWNLLLGVAFKGKKMGNRCPMFSVNINIIKAIHHPVPTFYSSITTGSNMVWLPLKSIGRFLGRCRRVNKYQYHRL